MAREFLITEQDCPTYGKKSRWFLVTIEDGDEYDSRIESWGAETCEPLELSSRFRYSKGKGDTRKYVSGCGHYVDEVELTGYTVEIEEEAWQKT